MFSFVKSGTIALIGSCLVVGAFTPFFWTGANIFDIFSQAAIPMLLALGLCFVIASGHIDLSVGSIVAISGLVFATVSNETSSVTLAFVSACVVGAACGALNGILACRISSFIVTLASMAAFRGVALAITNAQSVNLNISPPQLDAFNIPWLAVIALFLGIVSIIVFRATRFGLLILAIGSNESAARNLVSSTDVYRVFVFVMSGTLAGLGGGFLTLRLASARPTAGTGYELDAIAATIIGGALLTGGRVSVSGALAATVLLSTIRNSLAMLNVPSAAQQIMTGVLLVIVVLTQTSGSKLESFWSKK